MEAFDIINNKLNKHEIPTDKELDNFRNSGLGKVISYSVSIIDKKRIKEIEAEIEFSNSDKGKAHFKKQLQKLKESVEKNEISSTSL